jgi:hypothetical protein
MINNKTFDHRPIKELMAIVRQDLRKLDDEGLIDEGTIIKTIMYCNDKLGIPIREVKQVCIPVRDYKAKLPLNFEKLYYATALIATNSVVSDQTNPFDNNFDRDIIYEAELDRGAIGCGVDAYNVIIKRITNTTIHNYGSWVALEVNPGSSSACHVSCPNLRKTGKYQIEIVGDEIVTPFRSGELYLMYIGTMQDEEGNLLFPFHPMITPYYEWAIKEKIIMDAIFNSDGSYGELLKLAQQERLKAWLDAFGMTSEKSYGQYVDSQRRKELGWYNQYFQ